MKPPINLLASVLLLLAPFARGQSAVFSQGTNNLAHTNLLLAYTNFASAVALNPTDPEANVYYAMTRIFALPTLPSGSAFLTQFGFSTAGRDVYDWTSQLPKDANGHSIYQSAFNGDEVTMQLRNNVLPALIAAQTNLAQITATNFTLHLPRNVTHLSDVTIDYGDALMLQSMLSTAELYIYVLNSWNFNATVGSVSNIIKSDKSIEALLTNFPSLLTFATTSDKGLAQAAFTNAATLYFAASEFIRHDRPSGDMFLFNLSTNELPGELEFRETLTNLLLSLNGPAQPLPTATNISISMAAFFSDATSPRQLLPQFQSQGTAFIWNSWPDATLGGVVSGLTQTNLDQALHAKFQAALAIPGATLTLVSPFSNGGDNGNGVIRGRDGNLYGTEQYGGSMGYGSIFKVVPSTGQMTTIYDFGSDTNLDPYGASPNALMQDSNDEYLYGTTQFGGTNGEGTIFRLSTAGGSFKNLYTFGMPQDNYTSRPSSALVQGTGGILYGTTAGDSQYGGGDYGTIFRFSPSSGVFSNLYVFSGSDGSSPDSPLIQGRDGKLYGVAPQGGFNGFGNVFLINTEGNNFTDLYDFGTVTDVYNDPLDGSTPTGLVQGVDGRFYGLTFMGGSNDATNGGDGTIFDLTVSAATGALTTLFNFDQRHLDGFYPFGSLVQGANTNFYGVTVGGGANSRGSVFSFKPGSPATSVVWFTKDGGTGGFESGDYGTTVYDEALPESGLTLGADGNFYGITDKEVYELSISSSLGPMITSGPIPASQTVLAGSNATIQVTATGSGALTYQWSHIGVGTVSGATANTLSLHDVTTASAGSYEVIVHNSSGSATSSVATVTVLVPPVITTQPVAQSVSTNGLATFSVKATGAMTYQWLFDGLATSDNGIISGSATNVLTINPATAYYAGSYSVVVANTVTAVTSAAVQLTLVAERTKPSVAILSPKASSRTNAPVLSGTAADGVRVQTVAYWVTNVNNGVKTTHGVAALTAGTGSSSNWTIPATTLLPGTNILAVQSSNYSGLSSPLESVAFFYRMATPFILRTNPAAVGTITGVASVAGDPAPPAQTNLFVGEGYTLTAKPINNYWLTNWTTNGAIASTNPALSFIMESNLAVTANFSSNLFVGMAARYDGIFYLSDAQGATEQTSGLIENLLLGTNGHYSGKLYLAGTTASLSGAFNTSGQTTEPLGRIAAAGGNVTLQLNILFQSGPPRQITGWVQGSNWIASNLTLYAATTNRNNASNYTLLLPHDLNDPSAPPNYGYAVITNTGSMINLGGMLSDGTPFSRSEPINEQNEFPVYANLYGNPGLLLGVMSLSSGVFGDVPAGNLFWIKPPQKTGLYTNGFDTSLGVMGSPWTNSESVLSNLFPHGELTLSGGGLASNLVYIVQLTSTNTLKFISGPTNLLSGSINRTNGLMTLTFTNTSGQKVSASGVVLQNTNLGGGFFLGATNVGTITLTNQTSF